MTPSDSQLSFQSRCIIRSALKTDCEPAPPRVQVQQDRQHQIDAALVRTMKARRQIAHQLLLGEVLRHLRFTPRPGDLKKRIEGLIERDYMARDPADHELYNYVA